MDFKVIFKDPFLEDLERVVRLIAARDPTAAHRFGEIVVQSSIPLSRSPVVLSSVVSCHVIPRPVFSQSFRPACLHSVVSWLVASRPSLAANFRAHSR